jgi:hypothetical protein
MVAHGVGVHRITAPPDFLYDEGRDSGQSDHVVLSHRGQARCPIPAVKLLGQANALVISNAT